MSRLVQEIKDEKKKAKILKQTYTNANEMLENEHINFELQGDSPVNVTRYNMLNLGKNAVRRQVKDSENRSDINESESSEQEINQRFAIVGEM